MIALDCSAQTTILSSALPEYDGDWNKDEMREVVGESGKRVGGGGGRERGREKGGGCKSLRCGNWMT